MRTVLQDKILPRRFLDAINAISAQSGLVLCLDIGDSRCSDLSAQQLTDLSGSANHFYRGSTSGAEASDPTFNGNANSVSDLEYISFDGGDFCTPTGAPTFDDGFHKDSATYSLACVFYNAANGASRAIFGNSNSVTLEGILWGVSTGGNFQIIVKNGAGNALNTTAGLTATPLSLVPIGWSFLAMSIDEGNAKGLFVINGQRTTFDPTYSSPSATDPAVAPEIGARGGTSTTSILQSGDRIACLGVWNRAVSAEEWRALYDAMKPRFALS